MIEKANQISRSWKKANKIIATKQGNVDIHGLVFDGGLPANCRAILHGDGIDAVYCGKPVHKRSYCEDHFSKFYYAARLMTTGYRD